MKKLSNLYDINSDVLVKDIKTNSKEVTSGDLFVCIKGVNFDRHLFIDEAISNGAVGVVVSEDIGEKSVPIIKVKDTNLELFKISKKFYDINDDDFTIIGVTGTNGKTTVAKILYDILDDTAYIGTLGAIWKEKKEVLKNTTPDINVLFKYFKRFKNDGCKIIIMEASSEAFFRHRLDNISFDISILTNITQDHLNIHKSIDNYINCKKQLFLNTKELCVLNKDDSNYDYIKSNLKSKIWTYGKDGNELKIKDIRISQDKTNFSCLIDGKNKYFSIPLLGEFNVYNVASCILVLKYFGFSLGEIEKKLKEIKPIEGRCEFIDLGQDFKIVLDYAHTTDALNKILDLLNSIKKSKIITVTGSAGGREKEKRSSMGQVVLEKSDYVIFTMDDPRYEDVDSIIDDLVSDSINTNYERIIDRKEAILKAFSTAKKGDIVLIAGKGRDTYMAVKNEYLKYCDYDVIKNYFK